jgi:protein NRD1
MLNDFKIRLQNPSHPPRKIRTTTPTSTSPTNGFSVEPISQAAPLPTNAEKLNLLAALGAPPQYSTQPTPTTPQAPAPAANNPAQLLAALLNNAPPPNPQVPMPYAQNNTNVTFPPQMPVAPPPQSQHVVGQNGYGQMPPALPPTPSNPLAALFAHMQPNPNPQAPAAEPNAMANQVQALQALAQNPEAFKTVLQALGIPFQTPAAQTPAMPQMAVASPQNAMPPSGAHPLYPPAMHRDDSHDYRSRSRSPDFKHRRVSPPNRRNSPTYGSYNPHTLENDQHGDDRGGRGRKGYRDEYRQRSPPPHGRDMRDDLQLPKSHQPKPFGIDKSIPDGQIKGKSSPGSDAELRLIAYSQCSVELFSSEV